jgi:flagellar M-ring protein FliF
VQPVDRWKAFSLRTKLVSCAAIAIAIVVALAAIVLQRDARVALFSEPLRPEQVAEVTERLAEWNVAFVAGADNVRVDQRRRNELLLRLALAGVPHPHVASSSELLEKVGPLTPAPVLEADQRDGLAGDLALALRGVAGIEEARVIVAPARRGNFADDATSDASAGVRLSLHPGVALSHDVVEAIRTFVAAAVPGLEPKRVTVLDDRGFALGDRSQTALENGEVLAASLQSALDTAFGPGTTVVRVRVAIDATSREVHEMRRRPLGGHPITTTSVDQRYANEKKRYSSTRSMEDRGTELREEHTQAPAGSSQRISAAILVDAAQNLDIAKIRSIAGATVGLLPERGDTVTVESVPFARPAPARPSTAQTFGFAIALAPLAVVVGAMLLALRLSLRPVLATVEALLTRAALRRPPEASLAPGQIFAALRGEPAHTVAAVVSALPTATAAAVLEMYSGDERAAIVQRLQRSLAPAARGLETLLQRG